MHPSTPARPLRNLARFLLELFSFLLCAFDLAMRPFLPRPGRIEGLRMGVLQLHGLGDVLLTRPLLERLRRRYPAHRLVLFVEPGCAAFARRHLPVDQVVAIERRRFLTSLVYRARILREIAGRGLDILLQPSSNRYLGVEDALVRASGASQKIGKAGTPGYIGSLARRVSDRWYDEIVEELPEDTHDLVGYGSLFRKEGDPPAARPRLPPPAPGTAPVPGEPYVLCSIDASSPLKTWPLDRLMFCVRYITRKLGLSVVLTGKTPLDRGKRAPEEGVLDLTGRTSLEDLLPLIAHARLVLTADSAPLHLGVAYDVPTVGVTGGGLPERYHPYPRAPGEPPAPLAIVSKPMPCDGCHWRCHHRVTNRAPAPCLTAVPVLPVIRAIRRALAILPEVRA